MVIGYQTAKDNRPAVHRNLNVGTGWQGVGSRQHLLDACLHSARRDGDLLAVANADPAAGAGRPAEAVELAAEIADEACSRHEVRILDLPPDHGLIEHDDALACRGDGLAASR